MPDLKFEIKGVEAAVRALTPLLHFKLHVEADQGAERIQGVLLNAQIQLQCRQRSYTSCEKEKLIELFGTPERWGQTLRNRLWTYANTTIGPFTGSTETVLPVSCTYDLNVAATKYLYALEAGEISLLFLFSGSVFYETPEGRLQVGRISWNAESVHRMPILVWRDLMEQHYPGSAWLWLQRDVFDRLYAYKRDRGLATWDEAIENLLLSPQSGSGREQDSESENMARQVPEEVPA
jgi:hypothetical protein